MTAHYYMLMAILSVVMVFVVAFMLGGAWFLIPLAGEAGFGAMFIKANNSEKVQASTPTLISGRTEKDWYETVKSIGPEMTEELMIGPLNGLERDTESAWNPEKLMGKEWWKSLRKEWYPEKFCKYCNNEGCGENCSQARNAKAIEEIRRLPPIRRELPQARKNYDPMDWGNVFIDDKADMITVHRAPATKARKHQSAFEKAMQDMDRLERELEKYEERSFRHSKYRP